MYHVECVVACAYVMATSCLLMLLKCITIYDSLTKSKTSVAMMPILSGFHMKILTDEV